MQFDAVALNKHLTWLQACQEACRRCFNQVKPRTVASWYLDMHSGHDVGKFSRSLKGHTSFGSISPFTGNVELTVKFKSWVKDNLQH